MCDPLTLTSLALSAGSVAANSMAQGRVNSARDAAMAAERQRQSQFDAQAKALNDASLAKYGTFGADQAAKSQDLGTYFTGANAPSSAPDARSPAAAPTMPATSNDIVTREMGQQAARTQASSNQQGAALGAMRSLGDTLGDASRLQGMNSTLVGQIGNFKSGSAGVLPYELDAANQKGAGWNLLGDLLGGASMVVGPLGRAGKLPFLTGPMPATAGSVYGAPVTAPSSLGSLY